MDVHAINQNTLLVRLNCGSDDFVKSDLFALPSPMLGKKIQFAAKMSGQIVTHFMVPFMNANLGIILDQDLDIKMVKREAWLALVKSTKLKSKHEPKIGLTMQIETGFTTPLDSKVWINNDNCYHFQCQLKNGVRFEQPFVPYDLGAGFDVDIILQQDLLKTCSTQLIRHSKVFKDILTKRVFKQITIKDYDTVVIRQLIKIMHEEFTVDSLDLINAAFAMKLMAAAINYDVNYVSNMCEQYAINNISNETVVETLLIAIRFELDQVIEASIKFIKSNQCKLFTALPNYNQINGQDFGLIMNAMQKYS